MDNNMDLREAAAKALSLAAGQGAEQARVSLSRSRFISVTMRDGALEKATSSIKQGLSLSLFIGQRYGVHSTSDFSDLSAFVRRAAQLTAQLQPDKWRGLPDPARMAVLPAPDLGTYDPELAQLPLEFWLDTARQADAQAAQAARGLELVSSQGGAYLEVEEQALADSRGFMGLSRSTGCYLLSALTIMDRQDKRREGYWYSAGCRSGAVLRNNLIQELAQEAARRAARQLGARPGPGGVFPLVVENQAAENLFAYLLRPMSGESVYHKTSYLQDSLGQAIASPLLTITAQPHLNAGLGSCWFDREGVATCDLALIDKGVLRHYLLDSYYGKALNLPPVISTAGNLAFTPSGEQNGAQLAASMGRGLLLTGFMGGNFNSTTGDFSYGLSGLWVEDGRTAYPVEAMNMSGNFKDLWRNLEAVGNDPFIYSSTLSPSLKFSAVRLGGL